MKTINLNPSGLINKVYQPFLLAEQTRQIFFGGSSSGKSVFLAQRCVLDILQGRNYLICRNVAKTIGKSVWNEVIKAIYQMKLQDCFNIGKSEMVITAKNNGKQILFVGLDDVEKVKSITPLSGALTDIWIEEATEVEYDDYKQLEKRIRGLSKHKKRIILSFNPIYQTHWIFREFFGSWQDNKNLLSTDELLILKTTHVDNEFLTDGDHFALLKEKNEYYRNVYTFGNWGVLGDTIYKNWRVEDLSEIVDLGSGNKKKLYDTFDNIRNGLDFGFSDDPAAVIRLHLDKLHNKIYVFKELYERGLTNSLLAAEAKKIVFGERVTCDCSEPKSIQELKGYGINAVGALKGADSVNFGIQWIQGYEIIVDSHCQNFKNEITTYQWRKDKDGNSIKQPIDKNNHLMDAMRYALENDMRNKRVAVARFS
jgi:phage terminase large subunit